MIPNFSRKPFCDAPRNLSKQNFRIAGNILAIIFTVVLSLTINIIIFKYSADFREMGTYLAQIDEEMHRLNSLEWEIIRPGQKPDKNKLNEIQEKQHQILENIDKLENTHIEINRIKYISDTFERYTNALNLMINLLAQGDYRQAEVVDQEAVDSSFDSLNQVVGMTLKEYHKFEQIGHQLSFAEHAVTTTITFGLIFMFYRRLQKIRGFLLINDLTYSQIKYIFDTSSEGICLTDLNFNIIRSNNTFNRCFGEGVGKKCYEVCNNKLCNTEKCPLKAISNDSNFTEDVIEKTAPDGSVVYYSVTACPYFDSNGELIGIVENFKDITDKRNAAEVLSRYQLLSQHARDKILFTDAAGKIIEANNSAIQAYEYSYEEFLSLNVTDLSFTENSDTAGSQMQIADNDGVAFETLHKAKNGRVFPVEVSTIGANFGDQRILVSIIRDITERKKSEKLISDQKDFAVNLILNLNVPTFVLDPNHNVMIWNKACEVLTGVKAHSVLGTANHWQGFYKTQAPCLADAVIDKSDKDLPHRYKFLNSSAIISEGLYAETWFESMSGRRGYLIIEAAPIYDDNKNLVAVIETIQDFTERKNAQEVVIRYNEKLQKELELASKIQTSMLPQNLPAIPNMEFYWRFEPSVYVAGDMFNILSLDDNHVGFYILDVKGHGISAALNAVILNHLLRPSNYKNGYFGVSDNFNFPLPSLVLKKLNDYFMEGTLNNFFTIFYGVVNTNSLVMTYEKAGHCPPVLVSHEGNTELLNSEGVAIGMLKNATFYDRTVQLKAGDKVLLYTDGVMETDKMSDKPFMVKDLAELINKNSNFNVSEIINSIIAETEHRTKDLETKDDITVVGFQIS